MADTPPVVPTVGDSTRLDRIEGVLETLMKQLADINISQRRQGRNASNEETGGDLGDNTDDPAVQEAQERGRDRPSGSQAGRRSQHGIRAGRESPSRSRSRERRRQTTLKAESLRLSKFDGTDYFLWSFTMVRYLKTMKLWDVVTGEYARPEVPGPREQVGPQHLDEEGETYTMEDVRVWEEVNTEAETVILSAVGRQQQQSLTDCRSAKDMWDRLSGLYQQTSRTNKKRLKSEYAACCQKKGQSMAAYIREMDSLVDRLRGIGVETEEEDRIVCLLGGLLSKYETLKIQLLNQDSISYLQVCEKLLSTAAMLDSDRSSKRESGVESGASAHAAKAAAGQKGAQKGQKGGKNSGRSAASSSSGTHCYVCGDSAHISPNCPMKDKVAGGQKICYNCKEAGHLSAACPKKSGSSGGGAGSSQTSFIAVKVSRQVTDRSGGPVSRSSRPAVGYAGLVGPAKPTGRCGAAHRSFGEGAVSSGGADRQPGGVGVNLGPLKPTTLSVRVQGKSPALLPLSAGVGRAGRPGQSSLLATKGGKTAFAACQTNREVPRWILDSGSTHHVCKDLFMFQEGTLKEVDGESIMTADGNEVPVKKVGEVRVHLAGSSGQKIDASLGGVLYAPDMSANLFSVTRALRKGHDVTFTHKDMTCKITKNGVVVAVAKLRDDLWIFDMFVNSEVETGSEVEQSFEEKDTSEVEAPSEVDERSKGEESNGGAWRANSASHEVGSRELELWHLRMGHLGEHSLKRLKAHSMVEGLSVALGGSVQHGCLGCAAGKQHRLPFPTGDGRVNRERLELVHSDLMGPVTPKSLGGSEYILTIIDDRSRYTWVYLLKRKDEVFGRFQEWKKEVERSTGLKLKTLRSDNGGEYWGKEMVSYLRKEGVVHESSTPRTPE